MLATKLTELQEGDTPIPLREPGLYRVVAFMVAHGFVHWQVLDGPHQDRIITTLATGHPHETRGTRTTLDLLPVY